MINLNELIIKIKNIVYECGKIMLEVDTDFLGIENKEGNNNIVTKYDKIVQDELKKNLLEMLPDAVFIGEESEEYDPEKISDQYVYIVDPIDGTVNFSRGLNLSAISVALLYNNEVVLAVCYNPYLNEMYEAIKDKGAFLNGKPIHVSSKDLSCGIVLCGSAPYYDNLRERSLNIQHKLARVASDYRRFGSAVVELCAIASGKAEVYFELKLMPWDYAAGSLILKEAGGVITTIEGKNIQYKCSTSVLASNGVENYLDYIKQVEI